MPTNLKTPYDSIFLAGNDCYHGQKSIAEHGELAHANAFAQELLSQGLVANELDALTAACCELAGLRRHARGLQLNRDARARLDREAQTPATATPEPALQPKPSAVVKKQKQPY